MASTHAIASDLSYEVFQRRRLRGELTPCALDSANRRLHPLPSEVVQREAFIADRDAITDDTLIPTWHRHRGRKG